MRPGCPTPEPSACRRVCWSRANAVKQVVDTAWHGLASVDTGETLATDRCAPLDQPLFAETEPVCHGQTSILTVRDFSQYRAPGRFSSDGHFSGAQPPRFTTGRARHIRGDVLDRFLGEPLRSWHHDLASGFVSGDPISIRTGPNNPETV